MDDPAVPAGRDAFLARRLHQLPHRARHPANGVFGPDLTHLMSRATLGAGVARTPRRHLRAWVDDPRHAQAGRLMPAMKLSSDELDQLVAYLLTLR